MSDLGPPDLLLLSEENNDPASLESSNASSTLPLLASLDTAPTGNSSAPSDSQNAQGTNLLTGKEATGAVRVGTEYQPAGSGKPPSSLRTEVSQSDASSLAMMSTASGGGGSVAGDPSHTGDTTLHPSSNVSATGGISERTACLDPQQVRIMSTCKLLSLSNAASALL